ncbi:MAG TPA: hypothetical protein VND93_21235, partial [Myxococcales bacterium]|nr:hypothetical protein [Myxococcales bacterium]
PWRRGAMIAAAGGELVVWGGVREESPGGGGRALLRTDGARLDPATGTWRPMSQVNAPSGRSYARGVWMGTRLVVWGGIGTQSNPYQCGPGPDVCEPAGGGAVYDPAADAWTPMSADGAPGARRWPVVKRVGDSALVWGGVKHPDGGLYDVAANRWQALPPPPGPLANATLDDFEVAVSGGKIIVITNVPSAAVYDVASARWTAVPDAELPFGLKDLRSLGDGGLRLIVKREAEGKLGVGWLARVNADAARWEVAPLSEKAPTSLETGIIAWTGEQLVVWGPRFQELRYERIPGAVKPCGPRVPGQPICDPAIPMREVRLGRGGSEGGVFRPAFTPARVR